MSPIESAGLVLILFIYCFPWHRFMDKFLLRWDSLFNPIESTGSKSSFFRRLRRVVHSIKTRISCLFDFVSTLRSHFFSLQQNQPTVQSIRLDRFFSFPSLHRPFNPFVSTGSNYFHLRLQISTSKATSPSIPIDPTGIKILTFRKDLESFVTTGS